MDSQKISWNQCTCYLHDLPDESERPSQIPIKTMKPWNINLNTLFALASDHIL